MMKKWSKALTLIVVSAMVLFAAACGGGSSSEPAASPSESGAPSPSAPAKKGKLVVSSFGGAYEEAQKELAKQFEQEYNAEVEFITLYSADALARIRAEKGNQSIDVVQFSGGQESVAGPEDLIIKLDESQLTNMANLYDAAKDPNGYAPAIAFSALGIVYNEEEVKTPPTSWKDLWNPEYKGKVVITDISNSFGLQFLVAAARMMGGDENNIQPGFDEIAKLIPNAAAVVKSSPEVGNLYAQGEAIIGAYDSGYAFTFRNQGIPVKYVVPQEGAIGSFISAQVVKGSPNEELAIKFVDFLLRPDVQQKFAEKTGYAPTNKTVQLSEELQQLLPYGEDKVSGLIRLNSEAVNANKAAWTEEWNKMISR